MQDFNLATWKDWVYLPGLGFEEPGDKVLLDWSIDVLRDFFTDDWLTNVVHGGTIELKDSPMTGPVSYAQHLERATRIACLPPGVRDQLATGTNGIRSSTDSRDLLHLDLVLEVLGLAAVDGWCLDVERPTGHGKYPDIVISKGDETVVIEVTTRGFDRETNQANTQFDAMITEKSQILAELNVTCSFEFTRLLLDKELCDFRKLMWTVARQAITYSSLMRESTEFGWIEAKPPGTAPGTNGFHSRGPATGEKQVDGLQMRIKEKAEQTRGENPAWIRLDDYGGILAGWQLAGYSLAKQAAALTQLIAPTLKGYDHIAGVWITDGAQLYPDPTKHNEAYHLVPSNSLAFSRGLPGYRRRRSFCITGPHSPKREGFVDIGHPISSWYRDEPSWLARALAGLGLPVPEGLCVAMSGGGSE